MLKLKFTDSTLNKLSETKIVITGANGFIGKNLRKFLNQHKIKFVSISQQKYKPLKYETRRSTQYFLKNKKSKLLNCTALVNLIGLGQQENRSDLNDVNVEITKKILALSKRSKIKKFVYISGLGVSKNSTSEYFISKYNAEREIIKSGLDYTIFRASYIIGKNDFLTKKLQRQIKNGKIIIPGSGKYRLQPISINDVCKVILIACLTKKLSKKIVDLVGPEPITFEKYIKLFNKKKNVKTEKIRLEQLLVRMLIEPNNYYGMEDLDLLIGDYTSNHEKLSTLTGLKFQKVDEFLN